MSAVICRADPAAGDTGAERRLSVRHELVPVSAAGDRHGNRQREAVYVRYEADELIGGPTAGRQHGQMSRLLSRL